jgi:hypothetical protein
MTPRTDPASEPLAGTFPVPAASATPLGAVIRAMVLLRLRALLRPKLFLRFAGFAVGIGAVTWFAVPPANERQFAQWSVEVFLLRILPLLCLVTGGSALRDEIRAFTIEYLWTRPARKADLVIGAYAGALALTLTQGVVYVLVIHATSALHGFPGAWSYLPGSLLATVGGVFAFYRPGPCAGRAHRQIPRDRCALRRPRRNRAQPATHPAQQRVPSRTTSRP